MALPVSVPYAFANATTTQNLSYLDSNFNALANGLNGLANGSSQISVSSISATGTANATTYLRGDGAWAALSVSSSSISNGTSNVSITSSNGPVSINTAGNNAVYVDTSQNVGIGTTSPGQYRLNIQNTYSTVWTPDTSVPQIVSYNNTSTNNGTSLYGAFVNYGDATFTGVKFGAVASASYSADFIVANRNNGSFQENMRVTYSGNLLVGTTTTVNGYKMALSPSGSYNSGIYYKSDANNTNALDFRNPSNTQVGSIYVQAAATTYATSSDYRLKENVQPMTNGLTTIGALKPVTYDWIGLNEKGEGFIAHELQAVIPAAVTGEKDAVDAEGKIKPQGVDYSKIVVHLVSALQEAVAKIDALENRIATLETK
jgi:hypothetical protein